MQRRVFTTSDGSHSIMVDELRESFHSENGSIQESVHTFINEGLNYLFKTFNKQKISVFEVGLGTGLNALLSSIWSDKNETQTRYFGIEAFPLEKEIWEILNYSKEIDLLSEDRFNLLHESPWDVPIKLSPNFTLNKIKQELVGFKHLESYDLVFFDAFAPSVQPELWSEKVFKDLFDAMTQQSVLVTYSAAGAPRRAMTKAGFWIDEIRGAAGKREMTRAIKW